MTQLFVFVVQQISSIVQRTLCFNGRVDLLRFRVRADIFVDLPVLLCKGRTVSGKPGKDKQYRYIPATSGDISPSKKLPGRMSLMGWGSSGAMEKHPLLRS